MTTKVSSNMVESDLNKWSLGLILVDPTATTPPYSQPFKLRFPAAARITRVTAQTRSGTGTDSTTFNIRVAGADLADYTGLVALQSSGILTTEGGDDDTNNDVAAGQPVELRVTAFNGTGHEHFDVEIEGIWL